MNTVGSAIACELKDKFTACRIKPTYEGIELEDDKVKVGKRNGNIFIGAIDTRSLGGRGIEKKILRKTFI